MYDRKIREKKGGGLANWIFLSYIFLVIERGGAYLLLHDRTTFLQFPVSSGGPMAISFSGSGDVRRTPAFRV